MYNGQQKIVGTLQSNAHNPIVSIGYFCFHLNWNPQTSKSMLCTDIKHTFNSLLD